MADTAKNNSARDIDVPTKDAELRTLVIDQLSSPLRQQDRVDVIMRAIAVYGDQREREGRIDEVRKAIGIWDVGVSAPQQLLNRLGELKDKETKQ